MQTTPRRLRVFQFATGNVGSEMLKRIGKHPDLELVGLYCYSESKIGRDAGEIAGIEPLGVKATNRIEDVIAAKPDCANFNGVWADIDLFCQLLEAGINVVTASEWITGHHKNTRHPHPSGKKTTELIEAACRRGNTTLYGSGMNPGLANVLAVVNTSSMARVDHVTVLETVDVSCHHSVDTWKNVGYGRPVDDPEVPRLLEAGCTVFEDAIYMMADCFDLKIDDIVFECELGACQEEVDLGWWVLPKGSVGASYVKFRGLVGGEPRIEAHLEWQMTPKTEPKWKPQGCYVITIKGDPQILNRYMIFPAEGSEKNFKDPGYFASIGMTITGMPVLNAIRSVCEARPGIITSADLPLRAFAGRFHSKG